MTAPATNIRPRDPRLDPSKAGALAKARDVWESRPGSGNTRIFASFDDMLNAFAEDCMSWMDIGLALDVSRERVRQVYRDYFAPLFGRTRHPGRKRRRICTLTSIRERLASAKPAGVGALVAEMAAAHGLTTQAEARVDGSRVVSRHRQLAVNGRKVFARHATRPQRTNNHQLTLHYHFSGSCPKDRDFLIAVCGVRSPTFFIFPREVWNSWSTGYSRYIPERPSTYAPTIGLTDWIWQYENAWHLLRAAEVTVASA